MIQTTSKLTRFAGMLVVIVALVFPGAGFAAENTEVDTGWQIRFHAAATDFDQSSDGRVDAVTGDLDTGAGLGVNAEYRFNRYVGLDLGLLSGAGADFEENRIGTSRRKTYDSLTFTPLTVGLDFHLTPGRRVDLYFCPMVAWIHYNSLRIETDRDDDFRDLDLVDLDDDFAFGAGLGLGVPFGQRGWSFQANLMYLDSQIEGRGLEGVRIDADYDMTTLGLGLGYRF